MSWRRLSPLAVVLWVVAVIGFAGAAYADTSKAPTAADHPAPAAQAATQSAAATQSGTEPVDSGSSTAAADHQQTASTPSADHTRDNFGDTSGPQPISNADANTGGANGQCPSGPYCSTRHDSLPSGNGNGGGEATGKPCAGCVGKADNKNPAGQMPNGSDHNAGYECDTNHGIARTNPAHTGCLSIQPECVPTEAVPCVPTPPCVSTETVPCVPTPPCVSTPSVPCVPSPECVPTASVPCVSSPVVGVEAPIQAAQGAGRSPQSAALPAAQSLPNTGAPEDTPWLAALALASILTGVVLVAGRRDQRGHRVGS